MLAALALAASLAPAPAAPLVLVDDAGRTVRLAGRPGRIVSTAPSNTEALFALGAGARVVGATTYCVDPPEAREVARIGDFSNLDFERIVALRPDLVVATWLEQRRAVEKLESLGLTVLVTFPRSIEGAMASLMLLGRAVGEPEAAGRLVGDMRRRLAAVDAEVEKIPAPARPRVLVALGLSPLYTAGPGSTVHEVVTRAGGVNVAADLGKSYGTLSREAVIARDPEIVLLGMGAGEGAARLAGEAGFAGLAAVRDGRVHEVDPALLFHDNHRLVDGVEHLLRLFHGPRKPR